MWVEGLGFIGFRVQGGHGLCVCVCVGFWWLLVPVLADFGAWDSFRV